MDKYTNAELATARVKRTLNELEDLAEEVAVNRAALSQTEDFIAREAKLTVDYRLGRMLESNEWNAFAIIRDREIDAVIEYNTNQNDRMIEQNDIIIDLLRILTHTAE